MEEYMLLFRKFRIYFRSKYIFGLNIFQMLSRFLIMCFNIQMCLNVVASENLSLFLAVYVRLFYLTRISCQTHITLEIDSLGVNIWGEKR